MFKILSIPTPLSIMFVPTLFVTLLTLACCADLLRRRKYRPPKGKTCSLRWRRKILPSPSTGFELPPGPPGRPIIGHYAEAFQHPKFMKEWREKYGDIVSVNVFGVPYIFVYSDEIARELFEKGGARYSERPPFNMAFLLGWDYNIALMPYGDWWRRHIRAFHQFYNSRVVATFEPVQLKSIRLLLQNLLETPTDFEKHIQLSLAQIILNVTYAIDIKPKEDNYTDILHMAIEGAALSVVPGRWLVDIFPPFEYILKRLPGLTVSKFIRKYKEATRAVADVPFDIVKNREMPDHSFVSLSLERMRRLKEPSPDEETVIKNTAGITYAAAAGTTFSFFLNAIAACLLYPEVQRKVQDELDRVIGDRLPTLVDRIDLPYVNAFCHEVFRWRPSLPLSVAHAALEDDVFGEYFIPKGSVVIADAFQILRDENKYGPEPEKLNPDRYFQPGIALPIEQFGFGRRICPGRFFANNTAFLFMASMLKVFDIRPMKDENGLDIPVSDEFTVESTLLLPVPFKCSITPRSSRARDLVLHEED